MHPRLTFWSAFSSREDQDLAGGAVLTAQLEAGEEGGGSPASGDLVRLPCPALPTAGVALVNSTTTLSLVAPGRWPCVPTSVLRARTPHPCPHA
jgi:hypothetical protein